MKHEKEIIEFKESGLLWFVNSILHLFGWALTIEKDDDKLVGFYPIRVSYRGFSEESNTNGYINVSKYLKNNIDEILKEAEE